MPGYDSNIPSVAGAKLPTCATSCTSPISALMDVAGAVSILRVFIAFRSAVDKVTVTTIVITLGDTVPPVKYKVWPLLIKKKFLATKVRGLTGSLKLTTNTPVFKLNTVVLDTIRGAVISALQPSTLYAIAE